jgi:hypothetical protein
MRLKIGHEVINLLKLAYGADTPVMLEASHGVGKSDIVQQAATELGIKCYVIDLSLCEPMDLVGLPQIEKGRTRFAPPAQLPTNKDEKALFVIEELNRAPAYVRRPCLQLLTARALNDYVLPPGVLPIACVNPCGTGANSDTTISYDVDPLDPALESRFVKVEVEPGLVEWLNWAAANGVHEKVVEFVGNSGIEALTGAQAQPRAWAYVSKLLRRWEEQPGEHDRVLKSAIIGLVGDTWGIAFLRSFTGTEQPLSAQEILAGAPSIAARVSAWKKQRRVDLINKSWETLQRHLQTNTVARKAAVDEVQREAIRSFTAALPADLKAESQAWVNQHLRAFGGEPITIGKAKSNGGH